MKKKCECGATVSKNVKVCPKCGARFGKLGKKFPCRVCGTELYFVDHYYTRCSTSSGIVDGTSSYSSTYYLVEEGCPECGEPKPVKRFFAFIRHPYLFVKNLNIFLQLIFIVLFLFFSLILFAILHDIIN